MGKVCIGKREYGYICLINRIDPGNKGDSEIFGNQGRNCVFIRTLTDDVYLQLLFFLEVTGKGNIRFIRNERTKDHIVAVGFEPLDHICSVRLVKIEGYMLVAVYI